jgi:hypothetical protein
MRYEHTRRVIPSFWRKRNLVEGYREVSCPGDRPLGAGVDRLHAGRRVAVHCAARRRSAMSRCVGSIVGRRYAAPKTTVRSEAASERSVRQDVQLVELTSALLRPKAANHLDRIAWDNSSRRSCAPDCRNLAGSAVLKNAQYYRGSVNNLWV